MKLNIDNIQKKLIPKRLINKGQQGLTFNKNPNYVEPFNQSKNNFLNLSKTQFNMPSLLNNKNIGYDSDYTLKMLDKYEGFKPFVYKNTKDPNDKPTIGHGLTNPKYVKLGKISRQDSLKGVKEHIDSEVIPHLINKPYWGKLNDNQKIALIDYVYNIGSGNFNTKSPSLQKALTESNWEEAAKQMDFDYTDTANPGAKIRRDFERRLFLTGNREFI